MDGRVTLGRSPASLSTANLSPLAESTHINGVNPHSKFPWGGKMNPMRISTTASGGVSQSKQIPRTALSPTRKIDPRIYTDVQSNGLTSRIVKYHENSSKLNRSMSVGNLYNKPGEFPVVHLKKTEPLHKLKRSPSLSVVRIAPPEKTYYHPQTRSSILRTGSMIAGLEKSAQNDLHANRPILLPAENDINPTRSVLDALKEISRKRINSDDVDCSDSVKKYCKESDDEPRRNLRLPLIDTVTPTHVSVITKRQREIPSQTEPKTISPESNAIRKRVCTKNNDISSSLSSSLSINTPKRKFQDIQGRPPIGERHSPSSSTLAPPQAKQICSDRNFETVATFIQQQDPIVARHDAIKLSDNEQVQRVSSEMVERKDGTSRTGPPKPKLTLFNKDYGTAEVSVKNVNAQRPSDEEGIAGIAFVKPKKNSPVLSGKNALIERVQSSKLSLMLSCLKGELDNSDDEIDSVKEKTEETASSVTNDPVPSIVPITTTVAISTTPQTTISTVSTLVSNPPYSFEAKDPTTTDTGEEAQQPITSAIASKQADTPPTFSFGVTKPIEPTSSASLTLITTTTASTFTTSQPQLPVSGFAFQQPAQKAEEKSSTTTDQVTVATSAPIIPSFGTISSASSGSTPTATTVASMFKQPTSQSFPTSLSAFIAPASSEGSTKPTFSFGPSTISTTATLTSTAPTSTFTSFTSQTNPSSFGAVTTTSGTTVSASIVNQQQSTPATFGGLTSSSFANATKSPSKFGEIGNNFGSNLGTTPATFNFSASQQPTAASVGMFGTTTTTTAMSSTTTTASSSTPFGFGTKPAASAPSFNFNTAPKNAISTAMTTSATPSAFSFTTKTSNAPTGPSPAPFGFGAAAAPTTSVIQPATTSIGFSFSATTQPATTSSGFNFNAPTPSQTGFNFGATSNATQPAAFSFSGANSSSQTQSAKPISFGGSGTSAFTAVGTNKPASGGFSFNPPSALSAATNPDKSIFGSTATVAPKSFSFSGAPVTTSDQKPIAQATVFGSNNPPPPPPAFGTATMQPGKLFSFGATPATDNSAPPMNANPFGGGAAIANNSNNSTPLFPAAANISTPQFGSTTTATAAPAFNFGANTNPAGNTSASSPFAFGASSKPEASSKPFAFGPTTASQPENIFASAAAANRPPAFNFGAATGPTMNTAVPNSNNNNNNVMGAAAAATGEANPFNPARREIRLATRRLKPK